MNNQASLDINTMANLYEINSTDIGNEVARLSDNFLSSISLTDSSEVCWGNFFFSIIILWVVKNLVI